MDWVRGRREEGRYKREEIYVYISLIHFIVQQKLTQHCKETIPQLKKKKSEVNTTFDTRSILNPATE